MAESGARALRVGILGSHPDARAWAEVLSERAIDVVEAEDLQTLARADPAFILVFAEPAEVQRIAAWIAAGPRPPVVMLVGAETADHPHTRMIKALIRAKREWEATFDAIVDPVAILDADGTVVRANLGLARVLRRPVQEIVSLRYPELLGAAGPRDPIAQSLADRAPRTAEASYAALSGVQQVSASPLPEEDGGAQGLVVILKDVNDLKAQQERLLRAARLADIGQLAAGVAHEISTPLASIALRAESLLKLVEDPRLRAVDCFEKFPRYLKTIEQEIFRCKKIIAALLDFSRGRKPEVRETDLNALTENAADLVRHQMMLKQVSLAVRLEPALPFIRADDGQLRQAIIALLMNALDATPPGGHVSVETACKGEGTVALSVADDGAGIPRENLGKVFSPFFTTKPLGQGTGLGLAVCHGIVTAHGGEIRVESELGRGTRVSLLLPVKGTPEVHGDPRPV